MCGSLRCYNDLLLGPLTCHPDVLRMGLAAEGQTAMPLPRVGGWVAEGEGEAEEEEGGEEREEREEEEGEGKRRWRGRRREGRRGGGGGGGEQG